MRGIGIALVICSILASIAFAGMNENAKVAIHVMDYNAKRSCTKYFPAIESCSDIVTTIPDTDVHFFPVFFDFVEIQGLEYGVTWEGGSCSFTPCTDFIIGSMENSGDGISQTWTTCKQTFAVIPGFGWITSNGLISIVPHPSYGGPNITSCDRTAEGGPPAELDSIPPESRGYAGTNGLQGCDPCSLSVESTTWGQIKALFR